MHFPVNFSPLNRMYTKSLYYLANSTAKVFRLLKLCLQKRRKKELERKRKNFYELFSLHFIIYSFIRLFIFVFFVVASEFWKWCMRCMGLKSEKNLPIFRFGAGNLYFFNLKSRKKRGGKTTRLFNLSMLVFQTNSHLLHRF